MPPDLVARITASLASEQLARAGQATVIPLEPLQSHGSRQHRWRRVALVAAAAAVVILGIPALVTGNGPGDLAALLTRQQRNESASGAKAASSDSSGGTAYSQPSRSASGGSAAKAADITIYASGTAYTAASLRAQLQVLAETAAPRPMGPDAAAAGAVATPAGLAACLEPLGVGPQDRVRADLATFDGAPAVAVVVSGTSARRGFVLAPDCATTHSAPLAGPVDLG
jgi:hypothetical protein